MAHTLFFVIIGILVASFVLEQVLDYLDSTWWSDELPPELAGIYDAEKYRKSQEYERTRYRFAQVTGAFSFALILGMLFLDGFAFADNLARRVTEHYILLPLLFFGALGLASDILTIPFSVYSTFVIEERFGFNRTTVKTFITDRIKGLILGGIIGGGMLALLLVIYRYTGPFFWLIAWGAISVIMVFFTMFYSSIIVPLFNKQTPLEPGELRDAIQAFADKVGFKLDNIFVMDGSRRTTRANAYFTGLGSRKRIVLFDTLIKDHSVPELVAVLAHEIGHYKKRHTLSGVILSVAQIGAMLFILSWFIGNPDLSYALGAGQPSFHLGILAFSILYSPLSTLLGVGMNIISRRHEYEADRFAREHYDPRSLADALKKLSVNNLSNLRPHPAYVFFYYSHPPLLKRLKALES